MNRSFLKVAFFAVAVCAAYIYIAEVITEISGGGGTATAAKGVNPEAGEAIFFGRGKCSTCHSIGERGSTIRCPNLGEHGSDFPLPIMERAEERAKERAAATGEAYTAVDYLMESHLNPEAYVVSGYKNEMPYVWKAPIALSAEEILAVDSFMQTIGGSADIAALQASRFFTELTKKAASAQGEEAGEPWKPYLAGDPERGAHLFFDPDSPTPCAKCHTAKDPEGTVRGGKVGPELTSVAGTRTPQFIVESILDPSAEIASGFEPYLIITEDMEFITGVKKNEDDQMIEIMDDSGELLKFEKAQLKKIVPQKVSVMPGNFKELLSVDQFHDLLAFLLTLS